MTEKEISELFTKKVGLDRPWVRAIAGFIVHVTEFGYYLLFGLLLGLIFTYLS